MITVHHLETSRSQRVLWLLEELGVPYRIEHYLRDPVTRLAPPALKVVHPLGKSPVISDGGITVAESGAILEYLAGRYGRDREGDLAGLLPKPGTPEHLQSRFWLHYAEGSLMPWLLMKLVFTTLPARPMPFFAKPIARKLCAGVLDRLVDPNVNTALAFIEDHLAVHPWFAGEQLSIADFQMCYPVEAALSRAAHVERYPKLRAYQEKMAARPAYRRAIEKGGPVVLSA